MQRLQMASSGEFQGLCKAYLTIRKVCFTFKDMKIQNKPSESTNEINRRRTAARNSVFVFLLLLAALMAGSSTTTVPGESLGGRDIAWIAISFAALCTIVWSLFVNYRQADERQKEIQLKAATIAFIAVMFGLFGVQILHAVHLVNLTIAAQVLFIGGIVVWEGLLWIFDRRSV